MGTRLIEHMVQNPVGCDDPDCELHNVDIAIEEEVWTPMCMAFFLSGWHACLNYMSGAFDEVFDEATRAQFKILKIEP
jgi:hypothetical protein